MTPEKKLALQAELTQLGDAMENWQGNYFGKNGTLARTRRIYQIKKEIGENIPQCHIEYASTLFSAAGHITALNAKGLNRKFKMYYLIVLAFYHTVMFQVTSRNDIDNTSPSDWDVAGSVYLALWEKVGLTRFLMEAEFCFNRATFKQIKLGQNHYWNLLRAKHHYTQAANGRSSLGGLICSSQRVRDHVCQLPNDDPWTDARTYKTLGAAIVVLIEFYERSNRHQGIEKVHQLPEAIECAATLLQESLRLTTEVKVSTDQTQKTMAIVRRLTGCISRSGQFEIFGDRFGGMLVT